MENVRAWLPPLAYALLIVAASSIPSRAVPDAGVSGADKLFHVVEYGVFGGLLFRAFRLSSSWRSRACFAAAASLAALFGCLDETYQQLTPGRHSSASDAGADAAGALVGVALTWTWFRRREHADDSQLPR